MTLRPPSAPRTSSLLPHTTLCQSDPSGPGPLKVTRTVTGALLSLDLPFVTRGAVDLKRHGDELVVTVGSYRRLLSLPAVLSRFKVSGAKVDEGALQVRFEETTA